MISGVSLRSLASERKLPLDLIEKDYLIGWVLYGVSKSSIKNHIAFKGGTALSKIYYPSLWRISEDLDYTLVCEIDLVELSEKIRDEIPSIVNSSSNGVQTIFREPFVRNNFLRITANVTGPITQHRVKIEITQESTIGPIEMYPVPQMFDYPKFDVLSYSIENILAEKLRALIERKKIRDYYDTWKILQQTNIDIPSTLSLFKAKCKSKEILFKDLSQFFPDNLRTILQPYYETDITRLTSDPLPSLNNLLQQLHANLEHIFL